MFRTYSQERVHGLLFLLQDGKKPKKYMQLIKLLFFAERWHVRHFGEAMTFDQPYGFKFGSILSKSLSFLKDHVVDPESPELKYFTSLPEPDAIDLSQSQQQAIQFALSTFSKISGKELGLITHAYPEYDRFEFNLTVNHDRRFPEQIVDFFDDPDPLSPNFRYLKRNFPNGDPFHDDREFLDALKEDYTLNHRNC